MVVAGNEKNQSLVHIQMHKLPEDKQVISYWEGR